jgi:hypothetical protein
MINAARALAKRSDAAAFAPRCIGMPTRPSGVRSREVDGLRASCRKRRRFQPVRRLRPRTRRSGHGSRSWIAIARSMAKSLLP